MDDGGARILVADDDRIIRRIVGVKLSGLGYAVCEAADGREALEMLEVGDDDVPDLLLTDSLMPRMDGLQLVRALRNSPRPGLADLSIIMLSSRQSERDVVEGLESGLDDYVIKPFSADELAARVRVVLRRAARARKR